MQTEVCTPACDRSPRFFPKRCTQNRGTQPPRSGEEERDRRIGQTRSSGGAARTGVTHWRRVGERGRQGAEHERQSRASAALRQASRGSCQAGAWSLRCTRPARLWTEFPRPAAGGLPEYRSGQRAPGLLRRRRRSDRWPRKADWRLHSGRPAITLAQSVGMALRIVTRTRPGRSRRKTRSGGERFLVKGRCGP
jgi:hypothetical protein